MDEEGSASDDSGKHDEPPPLQSGSLTCPENSASAGNTVPELKSSSIASNKGTESEARSADLSPTTNENDCSRLKDRLERSVSEESKKRILVILEEVNKLSDVEKLLLYLKLPKGTNQHQPQSGCSAGSSRQDQANAITWIRSHLEEDPGVSIPKHEVYDDYKLYCDTHKLKAVSQADFGKIMKSVLPNIKPRRLGNRGNSKYCYAGLRKTIDMKVPSLPPIHIPSSAAAAPLSKAERELSVAASTVISEWAMKLLGRSFTSLQHIAVHLISNMYVDDRSMAAFTVLNASGGEEVKASHIAAATTDACKSVTDVAGSGNAQSTTITQADRHKATQMQLQRKLQERALISAQKNKMKEQQKEVGKKLAEEANCQPQGGNSGNANKAEGAVSTARLAARNGPDMATTIDKTSSARIASPQVNGGRKSTDVRLDARAAKATGAIVDGKSTVGKSNVAAGAVGGGVAGGGMVGAVGGGVAGATAAKKAACVVSTPKLSRALNAGVGSAFQNVGARPQEQFAVSTSQSGTIAVLVPLPIASVAKSAPRKYKNVQPKPLPNSPAGVVPSPVPSPATCGRGKKRHQSDCSAAKKKRARAVSKATSSSAATTPHPVAGPQKSKTALAKSANAAGAVATTTTTKDANRPTLDSELYLMMLTKPGRRGTAPHWTSQQTRAPPSSPGVHAGDATRIRQLLRENLPEEACCPSQTSLDAEVAQTFGFHARAGVLQPRETRSATPTRHHAAAAWEHHSVPASPVVGCNVGDDPAAKCVELSWTRRWQASSCGSSTRSSYATTPAVTPHPGSDGAVVYGTPAAAAGEESGTATPLSVDGSSSFSQQDIEQIASIIEQNPDVLSAGDPSLLPDPGVTTSEDDLRPGFLAPNVNPFGGGGDLSRESPVLQQRANDARIPPELASRLLEKYLSPSTRASDIAGGTQPSGGSTLEALLQGGVDQRSRHNSSQSMPSFTPRTTPVPNAWARPATALGQPSSAAAADPGTLYGMPSTPGSPYARADTQQHWSSPVTQSPPEQTSVPPSPQGVSGSSSAAAAVAVPGSSWSLPCTPVPWAATAGSATNTFIPISPQRSSKSGSCFSFAPSSSSSAAHSPRHTPVPPSMQSPRQTPAPSPLPSPRHTPVPPALLSPRQTPAPSPLSSPRHAPVTSGSLQGAPPQWGVAAAQRRGTVLPPARAHAGKPGSAQAMSPPEAKPMTARARHSSLQSAIQKSAAMAEMSSRPWQAKRRHVGSMPSSPVAVRQLHNNEPGSAAAQWGGKRIPQCSGLYAPEGSDNATQRGVVGGGGRVKQDPGESEQVAKIKNYLEAPLDAQFLATSMDLVSASPAVSAATSFYNGRCPASEIDDESKTTRGSTGRNTAEPSAVRRNLNDYGVAAAAAGSNLKEFLSRKLQNNSNGLDNA